MMTCKVMEKFFRVLASRCLQRQVGLLLSSPCVKRWPRRTSRCPDSQYTHLDKGCTGILACKIDMPSLVNTTSPVCLVMMTFAVVGPNKSDITLNKHCIESTTYPTLRVLLDMTYN